jgi:hydrogenase nickel incorporation protein HypA/HybF
MHELSIAQAIVDVAARNCRGARVTRVYVQIGQLRQVVPSALAFAFDLCADGTPVQGAELEVQPIPIAVTCRRCEQCSEPEDFPLACRACGHLDVTVARGEELLVESLELELEEAELMTSGG